MDDLLRELAERARACLTTDRYRIARRLREWRARIDRSEGKERPPQEAVEDLRRWIEACLDRARRRSDSLPRPTYPPELPVSQRREEIIRAIQDHQVVVVCGETGSGKTTQLPKICLDAGRGRAGVIGHTQPRRLAARSVAQRIADELGVPLGREVGYKIRFGDKTSPETVIKLMTDGILLTETQHDRPLAHYDTIIIDEAHERSLNIDFLLGYLKQLLPKRPDLKVVITSATIDPKRLSKHFTDAPIIEVSGRTYPVEIRYRPLSRETQGEDAREDDLRIEDGLVLAVEELSREGPGDILCFLPGEREIREAADHLRDHFPRGVEIVPLYAKLSAREQQKIFEPAKGRRVVLSTNIAETSLTVPGIRSVVDAGLARIARYNPATKVGRLPIEPISKASASQRSGRCGRLGPGVAIRLYAQEDFLARPEFTDPEILRTNLASVILQMKALRLGRVEDFPFIDPPDGRLVRDGYDTLLELGAIDDDGNLTPTGQKLAKLPVDPRIGRMILASVDEHCVREVLVIAAALAVEDPRERPMEAADKADAAHAEFDDPESDFIALLNLWRAYHAQAETGTGGRVRRWCRDRFVSFLKMREWISTHDQLSRLADSLGIKAEDREAPKEHVHRALLAGLLCNVGVKNDKGGYDGCRGVKFSIFPGSGLFRKGPGHVMCGELLQTTRLYAHDVAKVQPVWIERAAAHLIKRQHTEPHYDEKNAQVYAYERVTLFGLEIVSRRRIHYGPIEPAIAREIFIQHALVEEKLMSPAPFWANNKEVLATCRSLADKARRGDLSVDPRLVFDFYDKRLGPGVFSGATLDLWRKQNERGNARALFMSLADLAPPEAEMVTPALYPDQLETFGTRLKINYKFDPGKDRDGLTLTVPLESLHQVDIARLDWLVPGMLPEKVRTLLESLPKHLRQSLGEIPSLAARCVSRMEFGRGMLVESLARAVHAETGVEIPRNAWRTDSLPGHLKPAIRVVDPSGRELATQRSLPSLLEQFGAKARESFFHAAGKTLARDNITDWNFGDLPQQVRLERGGTTLAGFPALVDRGSSVSIQVLDSPAAAAAATRSGLRRLFIIAAKDELDYSLRLIPDMKQLALLYAPLGSPGELRDELAAIVADRAFLSVGDPPRTRDQFVRRLRDRWDAVRSTSLEVAGIVRQILQLHQQLSLRLAGKLPQAWARAADDLRLQTILLVNRGSLSSTPWEQLTHIPRYLAAASRRLDKLQSAGPARDARAMDEMHTLWHDYLLRLDARNRSGRPDPLLDDFRWMLEELRVSLFAQELGTAYTVSAKRLERAWADLLAADPAHSIR